ncbi:flavodoxin family protein [Alteriqipengyuania flavescens]|uniref:flavodoxin family protein n=1 Tax=Alteriqipengyuania flavescens TaxID=3053610 RepID=UPI0025B31210|nr:flavodoxin family protein [Alteriqipengyuania flavescens]WJY19886.1 flavodoxin family protein [Alteriqipengyuania flavescens]WJY25828.1 flavodoxin family protein [Alteriqipengyuania flavescens]
MADVPDPRKGMPSPKLDEGEFRSRYLEQFVDPAFDDMRGELDRIAGIAWEAYSDERKAPVTRKGGTEYADPAYDLSVDWIAAREEVNRAQEQHDHIEGRPRILIVNASPRSEHTCPGEMSKSWRLLELAQEACSEEGTKVDVLDLARLASEYGRKIHPCKACFSTAAALCHWPCSCYPNHGLGQTQDWMSEIYPMWVHADGVMLITAVHWYSPTSPLKLMMDRLVCADGGNPDPTSTQGKDAKKAKKLELDDWSYPRHLDGRLFSVVVHGDTEGAENVRRALADWLSSIKLEPAGPTAHIDRYIGYWEPYATSHRELDADEAVQEEVRNAARTLARAVVAKREGKIVNPGVDLEPPRKK